MLAGHFEELRVIAAILSCEPGRWTKTSRAASVGVVAGDRRRWPIAVSIVDPVTRACRCAALRAEACRRGRDWR